MISIREQILSFCNVARAMQKEVDKQKRQD